MVFITVLSAARFVVALKVQVTSFCDGFVGLCGTLILKVHRDREYEEVGSYLFFYTCQVQISFQTVEF